MNIRDKRGWSEPELPGARKEAIRDQLTNHVNTTHIPRIHTELAYIG